jgi:hypothetical protein
VDSTLFSRASASVAETVITDATRSATPNSSPSCYIYTGYNPPVATPRSIRIYWPISIPITNATGGSSTFSIWAKTLWLGNSPATHIFVNGRRAGQVNTTDGYKSVRRVTRGVNSHQRWPEFRAKTPRRTTYLDPKGRGNNSMLIKQRTVEDVYAVALQRLSDRAKAELPESQCPVAEPHALR